MRSNAFLGRVRLQTGFLIINRSVIGHHGSTGHTMTANESRDLDGKRRAGWTHCLGKQVPWTLFSEAAEPCCPLAVGHSQTESGKPGKENTDMIQYRHDDNQQLKTNNKYLLRSSMFFYDPWMFVCFIHMYKVVHVFLRKTFQPMAKRLFWKFESYLENEIHVSPMMRKRGHEKIKKIPTFPSNLS